MSGIKWCSCMGMTEKDTQRVTMFMASRGGEVPRRFGSSNRFVTEP